MKKIIYVILTILFITTNVIISFSQDLPNYMTDEEKKKMPDYLNSINVRGTTTPPLSPVRTMAEWEELQALTISWKSYESVLTKIVKAAQTECKVFIICDDSSTVKNYLISNGVTPVNVSYIIASANSVWIRDYGANNVYTNDVDSLLFVDWIYNRPRPADDIIPSAISDYTGIPLFETTVSPYKLVHTGGNFMSDGFETGFSSELVIDENSDLSETQIDDIMNQFMGISRYIKMPVLPYDGIHHIDMHIKLLDEETLLVGEYPDGVADGPQIEANLQYVLSNYNSVFGTPYKVIRIPMPPSTSGLYPDNGGYYRTYTNGVFVNKTFIVPGYREEYDTTALRILRQSLPGYNVVAINCEQTIPSSGAIHCITNVIGSSDPLLISHQRLSDTYDTTNNYTVNAEILHKSGLQAATVYYRTDTLQPYQTADMSMTVKSNIWTGYIPHQQANTTVYYYIQAHANSGKFQVRPITAPDGYWSFKILSLSSVEEQNNDFAIKMLPVYPNPSKGITCIPIENNYSDMYCEIALFDILSKKTFIIYKGKINKGKTNYFLNASKLSQGVYILKFISDYYVETQKFLVK